MNVLSGVYSSSIIYLDPRGHISSLREKNQPSGWVYMCHKSATGNSVFAKQNSVLEMNHRMTK